MEAYEQGKCEQVSRVPAGSCVSWRNWQQLGGRVASCRAAWWSLVGKQRCSSSLCLVLCWLIASQTSEFFSSRELLCPLTVRESLQKLLREFSHLVESGLGQGRPNLLASFFSWSRWNGLLFLVIFAPRGFVPQVHWAFVVQHVQIICKSLLWYCWEPGVGCLAHCNSPHKSCNFRIQQPSKYFDCKQEQNCHS